MIENKKELINTLTLQHRGLQNHLNSALNFCKSNDIPNIQDSLHKFELLLNDHLDLENNSFYPDYKRIKLVLHEDTSTIDKFIDEMIKIGEKIKTFFMKYPSATKIEEHLNEFEVDMRNTVEILNVRIETEEDDLYKLYLLSE